MHPVPVRMRRWFPPLWRWADGVAAARGTVGALESHPSMTLPFQGSKPIGEIGAPRVTRTLLPALRPPQRHSKCRFASRDVAGGDAARAL